MKKIWLYTDIWLESESIAFSDKFAYSSLILYQTSTGKQFLKGELRGGICSNHINEFPILCYMKTGGLSLALTDLLPRHGFVMSYTGHLENTGCVLQADLLNTDNTLLQYSIKKTFTSFTITIDLQQKSLYVLGRCQADGSGYKSYKILIFT